MPPSAMPASAWARAGASLIPSPTMATRRPACWRSSIHRALSAGKQLGLHGVGVNPLGHRPGGRLAVAGQDRDLLDLQVAEVVDHVVSFRADRVVDADHARDFAVDRDEQRGLARASSSPRIASVDASSSIPASASSRRLPTMTWLDRLVRRPRTRPARPRRAGTMASRGSNSCNDRRRASSTTAAASGWRLAASADAARRSTSSSRAAAGRRPGW